ncbi:branched-chain amino acid ABC transporter permease [Bradyrhizobium jicamae]|uniref:branched-chain amino acid ABC transporter permease n=1 Tax=Bradyrhizobium jicamae TaxID=280332 RepID=UPI001BA71410|nr:branched-chain amino acid ABC transporter permease [Bradyrhizobium jicamae]MBR0754330.1 branched-chain amino acid ABC transporter permease [Bradyrhizobium jicamae]
MLGLVNILIGGIAYGFVLFLMAGGLSITLGLMGFANMAHAALAMVGGYTAALLIGKAGWPFLAALAMAGVTAALVGAVLERTLFRRLYQASELEQVLLTIGVVYVAIAAATYLVGPEQMAITVPAWLDGNLRLGPIDLNRYRLFLIGSGVALLLSLVHLIEHTTFGAKIRAAVFNRRMTASCGIDVDKLYALAFALGSALAGLGGALSIKLLGLDPNFPIKFLTELLIVVSVGGLGSLRGTFLAAMLFGIIDVVGKYLLPEIGAFIIYATALALLTVRPQGLVGRLR